MRRHANLGAKSLSPALEAIAANVIVLRARRRISQGDLAERSGVSRATVSRIERAEGDTSVLTLQQIAAALGVGIAELFVCERDDAVPDDAELERRACDAPEAFGNPWDLIAAVDEAAGRKPKRYSRAGRPRVERPVP